jgi:uncharacterized protein YhbP (UPF0306 family)
MNDEKVEEIIREYIGGVVHMSLGTSANNKPWVCEVHFVFDDDLNLYFRSLSATRHCQEIALNPLVAGNIVEQHQVGQKPRGVYFEGTCEKLEDVRADNPAYVCYSERLGAGPEILEEAQQEDGAQFYKITIADLYLFDARSESGGRKKFHLAWHEK